MGIQNSAYFPFPFSGIPWGFLLVLVLLLLSWALEFLQTSILVSLLTWCLWKNEGLKLSSPWPCRHYSFSGVSKQCFQYHQCFESSETETSLWGSLNTSQIVECESTLLCPRDNQQWERFLLGCTVHGWMGERCRLLLSLPCRISSLYTLFFPKNTSLRLCLCNILKLWPVSVILAFSCTFSFWGVISFVLHLSLPCVLISSQSPWSLFLSLLTGFNSVKCWEFCWNSAYFLEVFWRFF